MTETEFFQAGVTYVQTWLHSELVKVFQCREIVNHPLSGEPRAFGMVGTVDPGQHWHANCDYVVFMPRHWDGRWVPLSPSAQSAAVAPGADAPHGQPGAEEIPDGALVTYHGTIVAWYGHYRATRCQVEDCGDEHEVPTYRLHSLTTGEPLRICVSREWIIPGVIAL
ncbi:hypothetical protein ABT095_15135 [Kitasatospora sp. NPDC002227]|uniref:hypothetical protein n=1 Tax=Kitasatospora sp. NPDC002227 TaxID=3154773 RepID=UPI0033348AF9